MYSGNKTVGKVESLFELCVRVLQDNIDGMYAKFCYWISITITLLWKTFLKKIDITFDDYIIILGILKKYWCAL